MSYEVGLGSVNMSADLSKHLQQILFISDGTKECSYQSVVAKMLLILRRL